MTPGQRIIALLDLVVELRRDRDQMRAERDKLRVELLEHERRKRTCLSALLERGRAQVANELGEAS